MCLSRIYLRAGDGCDSAMRRRRSACIRWPRTSRAPSVVDVPLERARGWRLDPDRLLDGLASLHEARVSVLAQQSDRQRLRRSLRSRRCAPRSTARPSSSSTRPTSNGPPSRASLRGSSASRRSRSCARSRRRMRSRARASARCSRDPELIELARRIIPPYSLAQPTIEAALRALEPDEHRRLRAGASRRSSRSASTCATRLLDCPLVTKVWPSDANFLLIDSDDRRRFLRSSMAGGTIVRDMRANPALPVRCASRWARAPRTMPCSRAWRRHERRASLVRRSRRLA